MKGQEAAYKILNTFNEEGWESIEPLFDNFDNFYSYLKHKGVNNELNPKQLPDELLNKYFLSFLKEDSERALEYIVNNYLTDVEKRGNDYYLRLRDRSEVADFFKKSGGRYYSSREMVENMMGDDWWEPYDNTTHDVYRDVVEVLNNTNKEVLCNVINDELLDIEISPETEYLEEIAEKQGHPDFVLLNVDLIREILEDEDTTNYILDEATTTKSNLSNIYDNAYNSAYKNKIWERMMYELSTYFEPKFIEERIKIGENKEKWVDYLRIKDFKSIIEYFLEVYKDSSYSDDTIDYLGSFTELLTKLMNEDDDYEFLDFRIPDWPDSDNVDKEINDIFKDYIYE